MPYPTVTNPELLHALSWDVSTRPLEAPTIYDLAGIPQVRTRSQAALQQPNQFTLPDWANMDNLNKLGTGIDTLSSALSVWNGMEQLDLARDAFNFQKQAFNQNYENNRTLTNARLQDRQRARLAASPDSYDSIANYMQQNGV